MKMSPTPNKTTVEYTGISPEKSEALLREKDQKINELNHQLDWFKRQLFGAKSEKHRLEDNPYQTTIAELLTDLPVPPKQDEEKDTATYQRGKAKKNALDNAQNDSGLRFDDTVPVEEIQVAAPELDGTDGDRYDIIGEKVTCRLAQKPSSYVILKYIQPVIKEKATQKITTAAAPANVLEKSIADVSLLAGLLVDKFLYHLPLHRQHQRIEASGIKIARSSLTNWVQRAVELLKPIYQSQLDHILLSRILAIDETPIKAGREKKGRLKQGYFWPFYGEENEICFTYSGSRSQQHLWKQLGDYNGTILSDGYSAYERYAQASEEVTHAQCWVHTRRYFEEAGKSEPEASGIALAYIRKLYDAEKEIKNNSLNEKQTVEYRQTYAKPGSAFGKALNYTYKLRNKLRHYCEDGHLPISNQVAENAIRPFAIARKNFLFYDTPQGASASANLYSLIMTAKIYDLNPYYVLLSGLCV